MVNNLKLSATIGANNSKVENHLPKLVLMMEPSHQVQKQTDYTVLLHMPKYIPWQYTVNGVTEYLSPALGIIGYKPLRLVRIILPDGTILPY